jgi:3-hydroxybutyryl-CoA dehydrogenase
MALEDSVRTVAVLGAGTMGHGIAQVAAAAGYTVRLYDVSGALVDRGIDRVRENLDRGVSLGKVARDDAQATLARISGTDDLEKAAGPADLVIEAAPEDLALKQSLFRRCDAAAAPRAILASNTSSLGITEIASATAHPDRVIGMHFFNPPHLMKLVEIVRGLLTSEATIATARAAAARMGKEVIVARDVPGFATSRLGIALGNEAMRMVEQGVATPEEIDRAMELGYRHPMGPFRLSDLVGLDVRLAICEYLHRELGGEQFRPPVLLRKMVAAGKLGRKTGEGFYRYGPEES